MSKRQTVKPAPVAAPAPEFAARIGLDWADQKHFWTMLGGDGKKTRGQLDNTPEAIQVWAAELAQRAILPVRFVPMAGEAAKKQ